MKRQITIPLGVCAIAACLGSAGLGLFGLVRQATLQFRIGTLITETFVYRGGVYVHLSRTRQPLAGVGAFHLNAASTGTNLISVSDIREDHFLGIGWELTSNYRKARDAISRSETSLYTHLLLQLQAVDQTPAIRAEALPLRETLIRTNSADLVDVFVPWWLLQVVSTALAGLWIWRVFRNRARRAAGRCRTCGYDMRATPQRCPECGLTPSKDLVVKTMS